MHDTEIATHVTIRCQFCQTWNRVDVSRAAHRPKCGNCAKPMLLDRPIHLNDDDFDRTIRDSEIPVLVDFYADWCGPCKIMAPAIDELAARLQGRALIAKLDTDGAQKTASSFAIRGVPTVIVFRNGKETKRQSGAVNLSVLEGMLR